MSGTAIFLVLMRVSVLIGGKIVSYGTIELLSYFLSVLEGIECLISSFFN